MSQTHGIVELPRWRTRKTPQLVSFLKTTSLCQVDDDPNRLCRSLRSPLSPPSWGAKANWRKSFVARSRLLGSWVLLVCSLHANPRADATDDDARGAAHKSYMQQVARYVLTPRNRPSSLQKENPGFAIAQPKAKGVPRRQASRGQPI